MLRPKRKSASLIIAAMAILALVIIDLRGTAAASGGVRPDAAGDEQMEAWWLDLEKDEVDASRALLKLSDRPKEAVAFLKGKMKPLKIDSGRVKALLLKLGNANENVWKPAFEELEYFDPRLAIDLPDLMDRVTDAPARQRMVEMFSERVTGSLEGKEVQLRNVGDGFNFFIPTMGSWWAENKVSRINSTVWGNRKKKWTRSVRAIVLLEHIRTPDAVAILRDMATGHPDAQPTKVAKIALERVGVAEQKG